MGSKVSLTGPMACAGGGDVVEERITALVVATAVFKKVLREWLSEDAPSLSDAVDETAVNKDDDDGVAMRFGATKA